MSKKIYTNFGSGEINFGKWHRRWWYISHPIIWWRTRKAREQAAQAIDTINQKLGL